MNMPFSRWFVSSARSWCGVWLLGWLVGLGSGPGCASAPVRREASLAHLAVTNHTDYEWRLVIVPVAGGGRVVTRLAPRQSLGIDVAGGDYQIEQTAVATGDTTELSRQVRVQLESGQDYEWAIVTLLSEPAHPAP